MTEPGDPFDRALAAALRPADDLHARPGAGKRIRGRVGRRRVVGGTAVAAAAAVVVLVALAGRAVLPEPPPAGGSVTSTPAELRYGPSTLAHPIEIVEVRGEPRPRPCPTVSPGPSDRGIVELDGMCYSLARASVLLLRRVDAIGVEHYGEANWLIVVTLDRTEMVAFAAYTRAHVGTTLAFLVDTAIWSASTLAGPITDGTVVVGSGLSEDQARAGPGWLAGAAGTPRPTR